MEQKYCPKCGTNRPVSEFYVDRQSKSGYHGYCKTHSRMVGKEHYRSQRPVVYAWFDSSGQAMYVGRGTLRRARTHKQRSWWTPDSILVTMACDSEWQAMEYEGKWGARYQPLHNRDGYRHAS